MTTIIEGIDGLKAKVGEHLGYSDYVEITQEQVNRFADATGDHQWIHVDPERAEGEPFGGPIAHGYLTLSLGPMLAAGHAGGRHHDGRELRLREGALPVAGARRLEGPARRRAGRCRGLRRGRPGVDALHLRGRGRPKPSCVADIIFRYYS